LGDFLGVGAAGDVRRELERRVGATTSIVIDGHIARDREQPRAKAGEVAPVPVPGAPRLLERDRGQVFRIRPVAHPVAEVVVDARKLLGVDGVPVRLACGFGPRKPTPERHALGRHALLYATPLISITRSPPPPVPLTAMC